MYMLDTNAVIMGMKHPESTVFKMICDHIGVDVCISVITLAELEYGIRKSRDTLIAAHARSLGYTLVTNNVRGFSRVRGLKYVDWSE